MVEFITPHTDVIFSHVLPSNHVLVCTPTLVLFEEKYYNSDAQFVAKIGAELTFDVGSMVVSSTISERSFEGDMPGDKGPDSCILAAIGAK